MLDRIHQELDALGGQLGLRARRSQVVASNIANADTPHFKARDFDFAQALRQAQGAAGGRLTLSTADSHHLSPRGDEAGAALAYRTPTQPSIDGNTVDLDLERAAFAENALHYQFLVDRINGQVKNYLAAIQG